MRDIKFRGKRIDNGDWVYGNLLYTESCQGTITDCAIVEDWDIYEGGILEADIYHEVAPETVGQYTGLKDKNGKEIYEGDILNCKFYPAYYERISWKNVDAVGKVYWDYSGFGLDAINLAKDRRYPQLVDLCNQESEVIGNIHDNPELLEVH